MRISDKRRLSSLLQRVQDAAFPDTSLAFVVWATLDHTAPAVPPDCTASVDAALELFNRSLPGWWPSLRQDRAGGLWEAYAGRYGMKEGLKGGMCQTAALAITAATLTALLYQAEEGRR